jgi:hypothetical protein
MKAQPRASSHPLAGVTTTDAWLLGTMVVAFAILTGLMLLFAPSIVGFAGLGITFVLGLVPTIVSALST